MSMEGSAPNSNEQEPNSLDLLDNPANIDRLAEIYPAEAQFWQQAAPDVREAILTELYGGKDASGLGLFIEKNVEGDFDVVARNNIPGFTKAFIEKIRG
jgi:hypothetical protein